jgi:hypothetical protein
MREFRSLRVGDIFEVNHVTYRKTGTLYAQQRGYVTGNAINVATKQIARFGGRAVVTPLLSRSRARIGGG